VARVSDPCSKANPQSQPNSLGTRAAKGQGRKTLVGLRFTGRIPMLLVFLSASCSQPALQSEPDAFSKTYQRGTVEIGVALDRSVITSAEQMTLRYTMTTDEDHEIAWPEIPEEIDGFTVADERYARDTLVENGRVRRVRSVTFEPFLPGEYSIPAIAFTWSSPDNETMHLETEPIDVRVESVLSATAPEAIHDISPPVPLPRTFLDSLAAKLLLGLGSVALLAALAAYLIHRGRRGTESPPPVTPPDEIALRDLDALEAEDLPGKGFVKLFSQGVSDILRRYIEGRFGIDAPELTTEEFLASLTFSCEFEADHQQLLRAFLTHCDLVKFAEHRPTIEDMSETSGTCRRFILESRQAPLKSPVPQPAGREPAEAT
jgi:hypothetical protein